MYTHRTALVCIKSYVMETACEMALYKTDPRTRWIAGLL